MERQTIEVDPMDVGVLLYVFASMFPDAIVVSTTAANGLKRIQEQFVALTSKCGIGLADVERHLQCSTPVMVVRSDYAQMIQRRVEAKAEGVTRELGGFIN